MNITIIAIKDDGKWSPATNMQFSDAGLKATYNRGSRNLQNVVAISQRYCQSLLTIKAGCIGSNGKN